MDSPPLMGRKPPSRLLEDVNAGSIWDGATNGLKIGHFDAEAAFVDVHVAAESISPLCERINGAALAYKAAIAEIKRMREKRAAAWARETAAHQPSAETPAETPSSAAKDE